MAKILDVYVQKKQASMDKALQGAMNAGEQMVFQELIYRINVLESCMCLCKSAPVGPDLQQMMYHYQIVDAYWQCMMVDHRFGNPANDKIKAQRQTALRNLETIIQDTRAGFSSCAPTSEGAYRTAILKAVNTVLPAWLQFRDTYVTI